MGLPPCTYDAAKALGISHDTLRKRISRHGIDPAKICMPARAYIPRWTREPITEPGAHSEVQNE